MPQSEYYLYDRVVDIVSDYLGPAAPRFIDRQIRNHLNKSPNKLNNKDMPVLIQWSKAAMAVLTDQQTLIDEFSHRMTELSLEKKAVR